MSLKNCKKIDYASFQVRKFIPFLYNEIYVQAGCGATLLSLLTGENPFFIRNKNEHDKYDWKDEFLLRFLKKRKFAIIPIKMLEVTNFDSCENPITSKHVIIISQIFNRKDSSWSCIYAGRIYHNFVVSNFDSYEFLNRPIISSYLVWHNSWI